MAAERAIQHCAKRATFGLSPCKSSSFRDPERRYVRSSLFNACLGNDFTARLAKSAIDGGFCAYDYLQLDTMMAGFRKSPEYPAVLAQAKQCRDRFLAERDRPQH